MSGNEVARAERSKLVAITMHQGTVASQLKHEEQQAAQPHSRQLNRTVTAGKNLEQQNTSITNGRSN
jgi:hypothetical protein